MLQLTEFHLSNAKLRIQGVHSTNLQLQSQIDQLKAQLHSEAYYRVQAQKALNHTVQESEAIIQNLNEQLQNSMDDYSNVLEKYSFAVKELSSTIQRNSELLEAKDREIAKIEEEKKELRKMLHAEKTENQVLQEKIKELQNAKFFMTPESFHKTLEASKIYETEVVKAAKLQTVQAEKRRVKKEKKARMNARMETIHEEENSEDSESIQNQMVIPAMTDIEKKLKMDTIQENVE